MSITIALWQTAGHLGDTEANIASLGRMARAAALAGAQILLCPECWLQGYNLPTRSRALAERRDGPAASRIGAIAKESSIAIAYGYVERDADDDGLYDAMQAIGPDGNLLANYRKTHLFGALERKLFRPGQGFAPPFALLGWKVGLLICYDVEFPEAVRSVALSGANLILIATALTGEYCSVPDFVVPARALENQIFVAYCNHVGNEEGLHFIGRSRVSGPDNPAIATAGDSEALVLAEIALETIGEVASVFPYRAERRPALYHRLTSPT